jgi:hypothetical protein
VLAKPAISTIGIPISKSNLLAGAARSHPSACCFRTRAQNFDYSVSVGACAAANRVGDDSTENHAENSRDACIAW